MSRIVTLYSIGLSALNSRRTAFQPLISTPIIEIEHFTLLWTQPDLIADFNPWLTLSKAVGISTGSTK